MSIGFRPVGLVFLAGLLGACASDLSGLGGSSSYSCPVPKGGTCKPMSQVYEDSVKGGSTALATVAASAPAVQPGAAAAPVRFAPSFGDVDKPGGLLSSPRVMRVYIAPWTDSDDNLMEDRRAYVKVDSGRWRLEHLQGAVRRAYAPIAPPLRPSAADGSAAPAAAAFPAPKRPALPPTPDGLTPLLPGAR